MRAAAAFLTVLGRAAEPGPRALPWFPVVGAGLGGALGLVWVGGDELWAPALVAALVVAADLAVTGMLHLDGLADSADGLLAPMERERRLAVMATPDTGAFAIGVVAAVLLVRFGALATAEPGVAVLAAVWCASRAAMAVTITSVPYARGAGLATAFGSGGATAPVATVAVALVVVAAAAAFDPLRVGASVAAAAIAFAAVVALARRRIGGYTGDVLGAAAMIGETAGLVVAATRW